MDYNIILGKSTLTNLSDNYSGELNIDYTQYTTNGVYLCKISASNTTTSPTLNLNSIGSKTIYDKSGGSTDIGSLVINGWYLFMYDAIIDGFLALNIVELPIKSFTFLNTLGTTIDVNGGIILFPFTATSDGVYVFDMTIITSVGNSAPFADTTTLLTKNGTLQFANPNYAARSVPNSPANNIIELTHSHKAKINLNIGDTAYFGGHSSVPPPGITSGAMIVYKIG
jgi:hypothetical protein